MDTRGYGRIPPVLCHWISFLAHALPLRSVPTFLELLIGALLSRRGFVTEAWLGFRERNLIGMQRPAFTWILIIAFGVFLGNVATGITVMAYFSWQTQQAAAALEKSMVQMRLETEQLRKRRLEVERENARQRAIAEQKRRDAIRQATESCNYWNYQLRVENTGQNRFLREQACSRIRSLQ